MTSAHTASPGGGLFLLCWGLFATPLGGLLATDYRGFAHWFERNANASSAGLRRLPPWRLLPARQPGSMVAFTRVLGGVFAVVGVVTLVLGTVLTFRGQGGLLARTHRPQGIEALFYPVIAAAWMFQFWRPPGVLRRAWVQGGRPSAVGMTLGLLLFVAAFDMGFPSLALLGFVGGGLSGISLFFVERRAAAPDEAAP
jgi:hypothetical protein